MSIFRNRLLSTIVGRKKWIAIGEYHPSDVSLRYRRIYQSVPLGRKVYAVATDGDTIGRYQYFTNVSFSNTPLDINNYTTSGVNNDQFIAKNYSAENNVFNINVYNPDLSNKGTYRTRTNPSDEWSTHSRIALLPTETIETESDQLSCHVYYFDKPLFLFQVQAATYVENIYILIDEKPAPQKFALFV